MALDLTKDLPRSPFDTLEGYAWLPRMIDKARAYYAGTHGEYAPYPCPGDKRFLGYFGLDAQDLGALIRDGASEEAIVAYVKANANRSPAETAAFLDLLLAPPTNPLVRLVFWVFRRQVKRRLGAKANQVDWSRIDSFAKVLAYEEGYPVPGL